MSQLKYRANLTAAKWPFDPNNLGQTVINPGIDNTYNRTLDIGNPNVDAGIPQVAYMENCLPTHDGYQSVIWRKNSAAINSSLPAGYVPSNIVPFLANPDSSGYSPPASLMLAYSTVASSVVKFYRVTDYNGLVALSGTATAVNFQAVPYGVFPLTSAVVPVNGIFKSYGFWNGVFLQCNNTSYSIDLGPAVSGLTTTNKSGILDSFGYLIFYDQNSVYWSSTTNPFDFTPSLVTGAGSAVVVEAKGSIVYAKKSTFGFIIYTEQNAVAAIYSGNARVPFIFKEIKNSGGLKAYRNVYNTGYVYSSFDSNPALRVENSKLSGHIAYTSNGFQELSQTEAVPVIPDLDSYLLQDHSAIYNYPTSPLSDPFLVTSAGTGFVSSPFSRVNITICAGRYFVISIPGIYSATAYNSNITDFYDRAYVYDFKLKRFGVINIPHIAVMSSDIDKSVDNSLTSIIVIRANGAVYTATLFETYVSDKVSTTYDTNIAKNIIMFGRFEFIRDRLLTLDEITVSSKQAGVGTNELECFVLGSLNGTDISNYYVPYKSISGNRLMEWTLTKSAKNFIVGFQGQFNLSSLELGFHVHGRR